MRAILERLHASRLEDAASHSSGEEEGEEEIREGELSEATIRRILARAEAGGELEVVEEDLTPAELAAFHAALESEEVGRMVQPWVPWWTLEAARDVRLGPRGLSLIEDVSESEPSSSRSQPGLPPPPSQPLLPLSALTKNPPSPLLPCILPQLLYAYCYTLRRHNGEPDVDALGAGETLLMLWPGTKDPPPPSPVHALRQTLADAVGSGRGGAPHAFFVAVVGDAVQLLRLGRSAVLLALVDAARMASRARSAAEDLEDDAAPERMRQGRKAFVRQLAAVEKKLVFFLAWANELDDGTLESLGDGLALFLEEETANIKAQNEARQRPPATPVPVITEL
ncbi:hypothetical protein ACKKBG_A12380 [Auxenochlorella protothecoides x Auxenochlorella symbiontica]